MDEIKEGILGGRHFSRMHSVISTLPGAPGAEDSSGRSRREDSTGGVGRAGPRGFHVFR